MAFRRRKTNGPEPDPFPLDSTGEPLANSAIVEAMRSVSVHDTQQTRALLFQLLLESTLVVVTPKVTAQRSWTAQAGDTLALVTLEDAEGTVLPVFTSIRTLLEWRPEGAGYAALPADALFEMAAKTGTNKIALDPGSPVWGVLTHSEIQSLARKRLPVGGSEIVAESTQVQVGIPAQPLDPETLAAVTAALAAEPRVQQAWHYLMRQGPAEPELAVGIRFGPGTIGDSERTAMRAVIDRAGARSEGVHRLVFTTPDAELEAMLSSGSGQEIFRR